MPATMPGTPAMVSKKINRRSQIAVPMGLSWEYPVTVSKPQRANFDKEYDTWSRQQTTPFAKSRRRPKATKSETH